MEPARQRGPNTNEVTFMISRLDIEERVREWGLREDIVEKDYVIGWLLWAMGCDDELGVKWAFKGGTCLRKCFLETYRFSEDLDFTVLPGGPIAPNDVRPGLARALKRLSEHVGIEFGEREPYLKADSSGNYTEGRIYYRGPRQAPKAARVKLDLNGSERVVREMVLREIAHPYPDGLPAPATVRCYCFDEIFAEKIRAMGERGRPRDLYDIINLHRQPEFRPKAPVLRKVLIEKCETKGVAVPTFATIEASGIRDELEGEWQNMLGHQLPVLPPVEDFWAELPQLFQWLEGETVAPKLEPVPAGGHERIDSRWTPGSTITTWGVGVPLETIRYAATNRLCVELGSNGTTRIIEPYSLRRSSEGNLLLYTTRVDNGRLRVYRVDRIESARVTTRAFVPRYRVELSTARPVTVPETSRTRSGSTPVRPSRRPRSGVVYIIQCPMCLKRFRRTRSGDTRLNEHKNPDGFRCPGSRGTGIFVDTSWP